MIVRRLTVQYKVTLTSLGFSFVSEESCVLRNGIKKKENSKHFVCRPQKCHVKTGGKHTHMNQEPM